MNLIKFLEKVDEAAKCSSAEALAAFVHEYARKLPETKREEFLVRLSSAAQAEAGKTGGIRTNDNFADKIRAEVNEIKEQLEQIENGELLLTSYLNKEYNEWYGDSNEFIYVDSQNIAGIIEKACNLIHRCIDAELYQTGYELADYFLTLEVCVGEEAGYSDEVLALEALEANDIISFDYRQLVIDTLYAAYQGNPLRERPEALHRIFCNAECSDVTLEVLMQQGQEDLPELWEFLKLWIMYLADYNGPLEERLLQEAAALIHDSDYILECARMYPAKHPGLYKYMLEQYLGEGNAERCLEIGEEALEIVDSSLVIRGRMAVMASACALQLKEYERAEFCWLEAFRSDSGLVNFLRLALESRNFQVYRDEVRKICHAVYSAGNIKAEDWRAPRLSSELRENRLDNHTYYLLQFFEGEFQAVIDEGMNVKAALGWSSTFMKTGIALFLLYLNKNPVLDSGCKNMLTLIMSSVSFSAKEYMDGLQGDSDMDDEAFFWSLFCKWRKTVDSNVEEEQVIKRLEEWTRLRVEGIMEGNHRRYSGECAAFIAALGEVKESRGEQYAKARLMESYKAAYSRRKAFHQELREFGMRA